MSVDDLRLPTGDGHVGEQRGDEAGTYCWPVDRGDDRHRTVDDVVNQVAGFAEHPRADLPVVEHGLYELEAAPSRESLVPRAADQDRANRVVAVDRSPNVGQLPVHISADRVQVRTVEHDAEHTVAGPVDRQRRKLFVGLGAHAPTRSIKATLTWSGRFSVPAGTSSTTLLTLRADRTRSSIAMRSSSCR